MSRTSSDQSDISPGLSECMGNHYTLSPASRTADTNTEEDYDCPICQDVFKKPVRTNSCRHVFCKSCFEMAVKCQGPHCPVCRSPVSEKAQGARDVQQRMRSRMDRCRACGKEKFLSKMRLHYKNCREYIEEYGPIPEAGQLPPVQTETHRSGLIPIIPVPTVANSALIWMQNSQPQTTQSAISPVTLYSCPYCHLEGLRDMALVHHCMSQHAAEITPAVCPICVRMPWGNAYYCSPNLIAHMARRHGYSYPEYMIVQEDEDVQLCQALQISVQDF